jgi:hypothetical protein
MIRISRSGLLASRVLAEHHAGRSSGECGDVAAKRCALPMLAEDHRYRALIDPSHVSTIIRGCHKVLADDPIKGSANGGRFDSVAELQHAARGEVHRELDAAILGEGALTRGLEIRRNEVYFDRSPLLSLIAKHRAASG